MSRSIGRMPYLLEAGLAFLEGVCITVRVSVCETAGANRRPGRRDRKADSTSTNHLFARSTPKLESLP